MIRRGASLIERLDFYSTPIPECGCRIWLGGLIGSGYGGIKVDGKTVRVHRLSWRLYRGPIPDGTDVLHHCDTRPCFEPEHLFLGTDLDNARDRDSKGRLARGLSHGRSVHSVADIAAIRAATGTLQSIADDFGVSNQNISDIKLRKIWRHIP